MSMSRFNPVANASLKKTKTAESLVHSSSSTLLANPNTHISHRRKKADNTVFYYPYPAAHYLLHKIWVASVCLHSMGKINNN